MSSHALHNPPSCSGRSHLGSHANTLLHPFRCQRLFGRVLEQQGSSQSARRLVLLRAKGSWNELENAKEAWHLGFQMNERFLRWDQSAQLQLVKIILAEKLEVEPAEVEARLMQLSVLLPDFLSRLECTRVNFLQPLLADMPVRPLALHALCPKLSPQPDRQRRRRDSSGPLISLSGFPLQGFAARLVRLKGMFAGSNIQELICKYPAILLDDADDTEARLGILR